MIHGIINVYKEKGFTSHDVVAKLRGITKQRKVGHTGTLGRMRRCAPSMSWERHEGM